MIANIECMIFELSWLLFQILFVNSMLPTTFPKKKKKKKKKDKSLKNDKRSSVWFAQFKPKFLFYDQNLVGSFTFQGVSEGENGGGKVVYIYQLARSFE